MTGKLADTVMSVRNGEQIARKYQPVVFNPSTAAQVAQRAKLKLLSQLSAVMATVIAIAREGSVSARNLFTKINFPAATYQDNAADINLEAVKLTRSVVGFPNPTVTRTTSTRTASISRVFLEGWDKVVFVAFSRGAGNSIRFVGSSVVDVPAEGESVSASFDTGDSSSTDVIYAYGIRLNNEYANAKFGNLQVLTAEMVANLVVTRVLSENDVTLSATSAVLSVESREGGDDDEKKTKAKK